MDAESIKELAAGVNRVAETAYVYGREPLLKKIEQLEAENEKLRGIIASYCVQTKELAELKRHHIWIALQMGRLLQEKSDLEQALLKGEEYAVRRTESDHSPECNYSICQHEDEMETN